MDNIIQKQRHRTVVQGPDESGHGYAERLDGIVEKILQKFKRHTWWMKLLGKKPIEFSYIRLAEGAFTLSREIILKTDFWSPMEYQSNVYLLKNYIINDN